MNQQDLIVGIDLGTTNSEIAAYVDGKVAVLGSGRKNILPSVVGIAPSGELLVGEPARNQLALFPDRTVRSIKRMMGKSQTVKLGDREFTPPEISALILRKLASWAEKQFSQPITKAVITVPAYFSDAQRQATREAAALAGLEAVRILNEPTAASLAYGGEKSRTAMVYDLGGGTFDVSIVTIEGDITEVLASHGNNRLGGDDFNDILSETLLDRFRKEHGVELREVSAVGRARLWWAAEEAKQRLSYEPEVTIREQALATIDGKALNIETTITREEYEQMILPFIEDTLGLMAKALEDAGRKASDLDSILLVGGSTRTPLVSRLIEERTGIAPREEIHPDLCVALGAGVMASRLSGHEVDRVLVDVTPYSFGVSFLGERGGSYYPHCYKPLIRRNTPLPVTRTERFYTASPFQKEVQISVYEGEDDDALRNILVGDFEVRGLTPQKDLCEILCRMNLDIDGVLNVTATEKTTGLSRHIAIARALEVKSAEEIARARKRLEELFRSERVGAAEEEEEEETLDDPSPEKPGPVAAPAPKRDSSGPDDGAWAAQERQGRDLVVRSRKLLDVSHEDDRESIVDMNEAIETSIAARDPLALNQAIEALKEFLFFVEGHE